MKLKSISLKDFLSSKGIQPDAKFGDYQDYIEQKQKNISPTLYRQVEVPVRGSIHLALGKTVSSGEIESRWSARDSE